MAIGKTICVKGMDKGHHSEGVLDGAVFPGMAIEMKANGNFDQIASALAASSKRNSLLIVKENTLFGKTVDDQWAVSDQVRYYTPISGDHIYLLVVTGQNIAVNDLIVEVGGGSGKFTEAAGTETRFRAIALEAPGVLAADTLVKCRWL